MIRYATLLGLILGILGTNASVAASSDQLRSMLERVPRSALIDAVPVSYVDHRAVESARPGAARPASTDGWLAVRETGGAPFDLWLGAFRGLSGSTGPFLNAFVAAGEDQLGLLGFDFFDVDRVLHFGEPPGDGLVLAGSFDPPAIAASHVTRGFTATDIPGWTLICGAAGCDQGTAIDLETVQPGDPFGGHLGRQQPLLASDEILLSSAALGTVEAMRAATEGLVPSIADDATVQLALEAIPADALLRQAMLVPSELLVAHVDPRVVEAVSPGAGSEERLEPVALDPIPPHHLVLLADVATPGAQIVHVVLVYTSAEDAHDAAAVLLERYEVGRSVRTGRTLQDLFDDQGVNDVSSSVYVDPAGSGAAAVLRLRAPLASPNVTEGQVVASSLPYRLVVDMVLAGDAHWLAPAVPVGLDGD